MATRPRPRPRPLSREEVGLKHGFRSGLEVINASRLDQLGREYAYESKFIPFMQPPQSRTYTPDFLLPNGIIVETKGRFITSDRQKMRWIKEQYPDLDVRFVFSNPNTPINKGSTTSYGKWAASHGFLFAAKLIPLDWLDEPVNDKSLIIINTIMKTGKLGHGC